METDTIADDLIWGASEIAKVIGRTDRQTFHMLSTGALPARKVGGRWVAVRKKLIEVLAGNAA